MATDHFRGNYSCKIPWPKILYKIKVTKNFHYLKNRTRIEQEDRLWGKATISFHIIFTKKYHKEVLYYIQKPRGLSITQLTN